MCLKTRVRENGRESKFIMSLSLNASERVLQLATRIETNRQ